jgi:hypothetical protein
MRRVATKLLAVMLSGALAPAGMAQGLTGYSAQSIIDGDVGVNAQGVLGVNMASGDANLQSNATALAISNDRPMWFK